MKAMVYDGPGRPEWRDIRDPGIKDATDAIVKVEAVTICGTDLHILKGDVPDVRPGTVLGHEAVGEVVETGPAVQGARPGDRVLVSCVSGCGRCLYCRQGSYGQCLAGGGWILGHLIDGTQAEYVRVPFADMSLHALPASVEAKDAVLLADILPTAYEVGVLNAGVRPGETVVVVGAGPIGLAAIVTARLFSPARIVAVDLSGTRLRAAKDLGADAVAGPADAAALVGDLTGGLGAEVVMEAVGVPETFELCTRMLRPGGRLANIGVHGRPATLHLEDLWAKNVTIRTGLVDTYSTPTLLRLLIDGRLPVADLVTHSFELGLMQEAYDVFANATDTGALKVVLGSPSHDELRLVGAGRTGRAE
jgi:alcohol dehydrogenase